MFSRTNNKIPHGGEDRETVIYEIPSEKLENFETHL